MKVNVQSVNFNVDKELIDFIEKKVNSLEKYYDRIVDSDVYLKVQQTSGKENKLVEIKMNVPGNDFVVKKQCRTFEEGTMQVVDSMKRQLTKKKEKIRAK
jgi:putative sigma-54 modulation protein